MLRRGVGIGAVRKKQEQAKQFTEVGDALVESQLSHVSAQLELFRTNLQQFAIKYKNNIKKDPEFRRRFQAMCAKIGVDPLASKKGFWSELLDVGDFYYELAVQIIEVCIITRFVLEPRRCAVAGPLGSTDGLTRCVVQAEERRADWDERLAAAARQEAQRHDAGTVIITTFLCEWQSSDRTNRIDALLSVLDVNRKLRMMT